jgi:hypothetical protein
VNASNNLYIDSSDNCEVSNSSHLKIFGGQNSLTGAHRCSIFGSGNNIFSNSTADTEKVRYVNIWGDGNEVTGQSKSLSIQGTGNKFIRSTIGADNFYEPISILGTNNTIKADNDGALGEFTFLVGKNNTISGGAQNSVVFGNSNNIDEGEDNFVFGDDNIIHSNDNTFVLGDGNHVTGQGAFVIGNFATSDFEGGCVINDGRFTDRGESTSIAKSEKSLFLDFQSGTHLNIPDGSGVTESDGTIGSIMYSGEFLLIKTGDPKDANTHGWGKIQVSSL